MPPSVASLDHLVLTVADITATTRFYEDALGMRVEEFEVADGTTRSALKFGDQKINLHPADGVFRPHSKNPTCGSADLCFLTESSPDEWQTHLTQIGIEIEEGPVARTGATGPIMSLYLRDPDGNLIEISRAI